MSITELLLAALGAVGTLLGVAVIIRGRQLARPQLDVLVGDPPLRRGMERPAPIRAFVFGLPRAAYEKDVFVPCSHVFHNPGKLAVTDIRVDMLYPRRCASETALHSGAETMFGRTEIQYFGSYAREIAELRILRPGETVVHTIWLRVPRGREAGTDEETARLVTRSSGIPSFRSGIVIRVAVWCANAANVALETPVLIFEADSLATLGDNYDRAAFAAWEGKRPKPGRYLKLPWDRRARWSRLGAEATFFASEAAVRKVPAGPITVVTDGAIFVQELPPWGFLGTAYDVFDERDRLWTRAV